MRLTGQLAIASGMVGIMATAVLLAFYLIEAPQAVAAGAQTSRLGAINDGLGGVQLLLLGPFGPISISEPEHLITKQLLCQLSYAGVYTEG